MITKEKDHIEITPEEEELGKGSLFATGLVAGGAVASVVIAFVSGSDGGDKFLRTISMEGGLTSSLGEHGYFLMGVLFFAAMGWVLYKTALKSKSCNAIKAGGENGFTNGKSNIIQMLRVVSIIILTFFTTPLFTQGKCECFNRDFSLRTKLLAQTENGSG